MDEKTILEDTCKKLCKRLLSNLNNTCVICNLIINNGILLIPCSHYQLCQDCFLKIDNKCPQCRTEIKYYLEYNKKKSIITENKNSSNYSIQEYENIVTDSLTDELYEMEYILYHINNRHLSYTNRIMQRRLEIAGFIDSSNYTNNSNYTNSSNYTNRISNSRFRTWWPE